MIDNKAIADHKQNLFFLNMYVITKTKAKQKDQNHHCRTTNKNQER